MTLSPSSLRGRSNAWAWLGLAAFVLGYFATWVVQFPVAQDALKEGGPGLVDELDSGSNQAIWRISSGLGYLAVFCLVAFGVGLKRQLDERYPGDSIISSVILGSIILTATSFALAMAFRAMVFDGLNYYAADPAAHITVNRLSQDMCLAAWAGLGAGSIAAAVGGFRGTHFSRGFAWFSAVMSALILVTVMTGTPFPGNFPAGIWLLGTVIWSFRQLGSNESVAAGVTRQEAAAA